MGRIKGHELLCTCPGCAGERLDGNAAPGEPGGPVAIGGGLPDVTETTDAAASTATIYTLAVGQTAQGQLSAGNDHDFYAVNLVAGQTYTFVLTGTGTNNVQDTHLRLYASNGTTLLADNDDGLQGHNSLITFTATSTGTYYLDAGSFNNNYSGQYGLSATLGTRASLDLRMGAGVIDTDLSWSSTPGTGVTVTYGFRLTTNGDSPNFSQLTAAQQAAVQAALQFWSEVAGINFVQVNPGGYTNSATMLFANYTADDGAGAYAYYPGSTASSANEGDVWLNTNSVSTTTLPFGSYSFQAIMHEIGHAIGLSHPGLYNAGVGQSITYNTHAQFTQDTHQYSVMSYFDESFTGANFGSPGGYSDTPMVLDVYAIQQIYGANNTTRVGDTIYGFGSNAGAVYDFTQNSTPAICIWDAGGIDTLDCSGFSMAQSISLVAGAFSDIGGLLDNVSIALGAIIENVVGGSGSDTIFVATGNINNLVNGSGGTDTVHLTYVFGSGYTVSGPANNLTLSGSDGTDTFQNVEFFQFSDGVTKTAAELGTPSPEIAVAGNGTNIVDGDATPSATDATSFGSVVQGGSPVTQTFTVTNTGTVALTTSGLVLPTGFSLVEGLSASIAAGASDTFTVQLDTTTTGTKSGEISFANSDGDENPFNFTITGTVTGPMPEIAVAGNGTNIVDGDTTPSATDGTSFGSVTQGGSPLTQTFTVTNTGTVALTTSALVLPTGFSLVEGLSASIAAGASDTFTVQLDTTTTGTKSGQISFTNNDGDENPFNFSVTGTVSAPTTTNYSITPGSVTVNEGAGTVTFTVNRSGLLPAEMIFASTTQNQGSTNSGDFTNLSSQVLNFASGQTSITVTVSLINDTAIESNETFGLIVQRSFRDPITTFLASATFTIQDNDTPGPAPEIAVAGNGTNIVDGDTTPSATDATSFGSVVQGGSPVTQTFTVSNTGAAALTTSALVLPTGFSLVEGLSASIAAGGSDTFTVQLDTTSTGTKSGQISFTNNDGDENPFNFTITGTVTGAPAPEIAVAGNGANIVDGDTTPSATDATSFGSVVQGGSPVTQTFTVTNTGTAALTTSGLVLPTGFSLVEGLSASIAAGASDTFTVQLDTTTTGTKSGQISFANNDGDENPFNFTISGTVTGPLPEVAVAGNGANIVDGDTTPSATDGTSFGSVTQGGSPLTQTFTVSNTGAAALTTSALVLPTGFSLVEGLSASIAAGASDTFTVQLDTTTTGTKSGQISFTNNDGDENPFNFSITGTVNSPTTTSYSIVPGSVTVNEGAGTVTFTVNRSGLLSAETIFASTTQDQGSTNSGDFTNLNKLGVSFASGQTSATVTVSLINDTAIESNETFGLIVQRTSRDPLTTFLASATFTIQDNDTPGPAPEIAVAGNGANIADGDTTPSGTDATSFGSVAQGGSPLTQTFTVSNTGAAALTTSALVLPTGFSLVEGLSASIAAGASDTFTVQLDTATTGTKSGQISFANNDGDENPFNFAVTGTVTGTTTSYSITPGSVTVNEGAGTVTFTINRAGNLPTETIFASTTQNQGSTNSGDFTTLNDQSVNFASGQTSATVTVSLINDTAVENNETFGLVVQASSSDPLTTFLASATFTIQDNDSRIPFAAGAQGSDTFDFGASGNAFVSDLGGRSEGTFSCGSHDVFVFDKLGALSDLAASAKLGDVIALEGGVLAGFAEVLSAGQQAASNLVITTADGDALTLHNMLAHLHANDYLIR